MAAVRSVRRWQELPERRPWWVVLAWVAAAAACVAFAPSLGDVAVRDDAAFLPSSSPSQRAEAALARLFPGETDRRAAVIVFERSGGLRSGDRAYVATTARQLAAPDMRDDIVRVVAAATTPQQAAFLRSEDGAAELLIATLRGASFSEEASGQLERLRARLDASAPPGLQHDVTGPVALAADQTSAVLDSFKRTALATIVLVLAILMIVYRAIVAPLVSLATIAIAFLVARGVLAVFADHGFDVAVFTETFMIVLVFGAGTDYCLLLISRYREEAAGGGRPLSRTTRAVTGVIAASAATVIAGQLALGAARFGMVRTMGPSVALAVAVTALAALTFTPAVLRLVGRSLFWPAPARSSTPQRPSRLGRVADTVLARPAPALILAVAILAVPAVGALGLRATLDAVDDLPGSAEAKQGFQTLTAHFPGGRLSPVSILVRSKTGFVDDANLRAVDQLTDVLRREPDVAEVRSVTQPAGEPLTLENAAKLGASFDLAALDLPPQLVAQASERLSSPRGLRVDASLLRASPALASQLSPFLGTDGRSTRLLVTLDGNPYSEAGFEQVDRLGDASERLVARAMPASEVLVGGPVALSVDMKAINDGDFRRIALLLVIGVTLVLGLLLRSLVAPVYLLASILLAFAATLGILVGLFQGALDHAGVSSPAPTFLFVILVALGADYSIFMAARVREELVDNSLRQAVRTAMTRTGPVVLAAAAILAGTFIALVSVDMPMLRQVGIAVAIGVFLNAAVACLVAIPAITVLVGRRAFWPGLRHTSVAGTDDGQSPVLTATAVRDQEPSA